MNKKLFYFNGINAENGTYLLSPTKDAFNLANKECDVGKAAALAMFWSQKPKAGLPYGLDPRVVADVGWGIVFHRDEKKAVVHACKKLIELRSKGVPENKLKILQYIEGDTVPDWLARMGLGLGDLDPERVPYYLLVVGDPRLIPFSFVQQLALHYSVGCLHFDKPAAYEQYIANVQASEKMPASTRGPRLRIFAPSNDPATELTCEHLAQELLTRLGAHAQGSELLAHNATKDRLLKVLGSSSFEVLFSASHGLGYPIGDPRQYSCQGALLCQDWPGNGAPQTEHFISAGDIASDFDLLGKVVFCFACFSSGTPDEDRFLHLGGIEPPRIAPNSFYSSLNKRLLSKEKRSSRGNRAY